MKKIISILLCVCMTVGVMSAAFAADTDEMKKVLETVKSRIGSTDGYDKFESNVYTDYNGETEYRFSWRNDEDILEVTAHSDGIITSYDVYGENAYKSVPISERALKTELKTVAEAFVKQLNPDIALELKVGEIDLRSNSARADVIEYKNGYPIFGLRGYIEVDPTGEKLLSFGIDNIVSQKFETGNVISKTEAIQKFKENLGAELYYSVEREWNDDDQNTQITIEPKYRIKYPQKFISAVNGEIVELNERFDNEVSYSAAMDRVSEDSETGTGTFSEAELDEISKTESLIKPEKAFEIIKSIKCADVPDIKFEDLNKRLTKSYRDETKQYYFSYYNESNNDTTVMFYASVDAENGEIKNIYSNTFSSGHGSEKDAEISDDETKTITENAIKELAPEKYSEYRFDTVNNGYCVYTRYVNGIPVNNDNIRIAVNPENKKISSYNITYTKGEFPDISNVLKKSEAEDVLINQIGYDIEYIYSDEEYKLCYVISDTNAEIDPFTGIVKETDVSLAEEYTDIDGHYAEEAVNALAESGIGFDGDELKPDEPIKQKEFAALVEQVIKDNYRIIIRDDYDYDSLYDYIDFIAPEEVNPDGTVTRRDAAKFTVRAMGYIDIAKLDIFKSMFNDMTEDVGYASILAGLKILSGDGNGNFNPEGVLTRAQALIIIYNYLNK